MMIMYLSHYLKIMIENEKSMEIWGRQTDTIFGKVCTIPCGIMLIHHDT